MSTRAAFPTESQFDALEGEIDRLGHDLVTERFAAMFPLLSRYKVEEGFDCLTVADAERLLVDLRAIRSYR